MLPNVTCAGRGCLVSDDMNVGTGRLATMLKITSVVIVFVVACAVAVNKYRQQ